MTVRLVILLVFLLSSSPPAVADIRNPAANAPAAEKEAFALSNQATELESRGLSGTDKLYMRAIELLEKEYGPDDARVGDYLYQLARTYHLQGDRAQELRIWERLLALREKVPPDSPARNQQFGDTLMNLAAWHATTLDYARSEPIYRRALAFYDKVYGPNSRQLATALSIPAGGFRGQGDYGRAQQIDERILAIYEKRPDRQDSELIGPLFLLAEDCKQRGLYTQAESYLKRVLTIVEKLPKPAKGQENGTEAGAYVAFASQLAILYERQGRIEEAKAIHQRAESLLIEGLKRAEELFSADPQHNGWALKTGLDFLATHYTQRRLLEKATALQERLLELDRKQHGPDSVSAAGQEITLASLLERRGELERARTLLLHSDKIFLATGRVVVSNAAFPLYSIAHAQGDYPEAMKWLEALRQGYEKMRGPAGATGYLQLQARLYLAMRKVTKALECLRTSIERIEPRIQLLSSNGTEQDKRRLVSLFADQVDAAVGLHVEYAPKNARALELAMTTVLRRKGRAIDASSASTAALHKRLGPAEQSKLEQLASARSVLGRLVLQPPATPTAEYGRQIAELEDKIRHLEAELYTASPELRVESTPVTLDAVKAALPEDGALIEIIAYYPDDPRKPIAADWRPPDPADRRYVAYIQLPKGPPRYVELGKVGSIDAQIKKLRHALASPTRGDAQELARAFDEVAMRPVRALLGDAKQLFLAPDGALNLVPFGALVSEDGRFLLQRYTITYLSTGRELIRLRSQRLPTRKKAVIIANPIFGEPRTAEEVQADADQTLRGRRSRDLQLTLNFGQLPATEQEAQSISELLGDASVMTGAQATEAALKQLSGPRTLHIATHGFFLPSQHNQDLEENPLLRSGLILAGANRLQSGDEDGVLTALEASGLDLGGTQLVVLSACETGLGQVQSGDGVYGLRRSLVVAGAETLVMSLWQVDDSATRDLMIGFYRRLRQGKGRSEALRQAQLKLLNSDETQHPYYWASFIPAGDWQPLHQ